MDQLAAVAGRAGHALRIDCTSLEVTPVPLPDDLTVLVVHSGQHRQLASSAYAARAADCAAAEAQIGPLRGAGLADTDRIGDPVVRRRARHVVTENARVDDFAAALSVGDRAALGQLMAESHSSLRDDFEVSTPVIDDLVEHLTSTAGVVGARLTGAGFGGCVVALADRERSNPTEGQPVRASDGAFVRSAV